MNNFNFNSLTEMNESITDPGLKKAKDGLAKSFTKLNQAFIAYQNEMTAANKAIPRENGSAMKKAIKMRQDADDQGFSGIRNVHKKIITLLTDANR